MPPSSEFAANVELVTSGDASQVRDAPGGMPQLYSQLEKTVSGRLGTSVLGEAAPQVFIPADGRIDASGVRGSCLQVEMVVRCRK